jgi:parallel beta-helix repeat protein
MIRNNWVHHIAKNVSCTSAGGSAIGVDSYYRGIKSDVISNLVHDIGPVGCRYVQGIYVSTSGTVKNNVVYRVAEGGIHLWHDATNVIITNNTVVASNTGIIVGGGDYYHTSGPNNNTIVANNIVYDNRMGISEQGQTGTGNRYTNNLVYQNSTYNYSLKNGLSPSASVSAVPGFVSYTRTGTPDLHIVSTSPAVGKGTATNAPATDFDDKPRNATTGYDIGAYQH